MDRIINIAIIGCSAIADKTVLPTIKGNSKFNLVMVGSRSIEKGQQFALKYECDFGNYEDVLNSTEVDAVYVSVPTGLHFEWGLKVLRAGKNLLLEKPFTSTIEQAEEIIEYAKSTDLIAMEGLAYVYHPYFLAIKDLLSQNVIGEVRLLDSAFGFPKLPLSDIRNQKNIGGGAILDNLIYPLSSALSLFGREYKKISYHLVIDEDLEIDERGVVRIDWNNKSANLTYGFGFSYKNIIEIWGSEGTLTIDRAFTKPANSIAEIIIKKGGSENKIVSIEPVNQFHLMLDGFYNKINRIDTSGKNEREDILARMRVISEMYKSVI
ncbi:Gfo/Idh/MocA family protein [Pedobacter sp. GR22-10]|uniref:Gfo/Idh/MocA family protein n=1 Tax=Pedobacter sp. GR22-10 TaxID=2994472 RepID=UPI00224624CC|nr:Gfo/Idh/MocA family oxidoreductase [Pedobacter sp. GR22-10]MCX2432366.1 Gfo/Idh/MocA family oxidoreductase [Pedobacter sp. GR22-10]